MQIDIICPCNHIANSKFELLIKPKQSACGHFDYKFYKTNDLTKYLNIYYFESKLFINYYYHNKNIIIVNNNSNSINFYYNKPNLNLDDIVLKYQNLLNIS